jgi:hypothetical protein
LALTLSMVSLLSTSRVMVFPVSVFTKICISSSILRSLASLCLVPLLAELSQSCRDGAFVLLEGGDGYGCLSESGGAEGLVSVYIAGGHAHPAS